ncbi:MAG: hypothetical protein JW747_07620, partial [Candidatus Aminicenantes bacterium]|nr:hypothetical protein [Candidatus Aminicenantes bacterium]
MPLYKHLVVVLTAALALSPAAAGTPSETQRRIVLLENAADTSLRDWEWTSQDVSGRETARFPEPEWAPLRREAAIRAEAFRLRLKFKAPEALAGLNLQGRALELACVFRGAGLYRGRFSLNDREIRSFELDFGNRGSSLPLKLPLTESA